MVETTAKRADDYGILEDLEGRDAAAAARGMDERLHMCFTRVELGNLQVAICEVLSYHRYSTVGSILKKLELKLHGALLGAAVLDSARRRAQEEGAGRTQEVT